MPRLAALMLILFVLPVSAQDFDPAKLDPETLPWGAVAREGTLRLRHSGPIMRVAFSPDGKGIMSAGAGGFVYLWDAASGKRAKAWYHAGAVTNGCFTVGGLGILTKCSHGPFTGVPLSAKNIPEALLQTPQ